MKVKCMECGFTYERKVLWEGMCPMCGCSRWVMSLKDSEKLFSDSLKKVGDLEKVKNDYINNPIYHGNYEVGLFMIQIIDILKDLIRRQQNMSVNFNYLEILKDFLKQMNRDYRDFIEKHLLADLSIDPLELSRLYQAQLERIENIKI